MNNQQLELDGPLKLGVWMVAFIYDGRRIATTEFFITPQIGSDQSLLQFGPIESTQHKAWEKYLPDDAKSVAARRARSALLFNNDTISFLDKMVAEFYAIQDICYIGHPPTNCATKIHDWQPCLITDWSSFSQDPKSHL